jgi:large subunit ribosomal protein L14e
MFEIGRIVVKLAGRDAGLKGVIVDILEKGFVLIDGQVRRRKCNILHIEPLDKTIKISKNASHDEVVNVLDAEGIKVESKTKKNAAPRPLKKRANNVVEEPVDNKKSKKSFSKNKKL